MSTWINFKEIRETLDFRTVLEHYNLQLKAKGDQHQGFCPLPNHQGTGKSRSFSVSFRKRVFHCFGCQAHGNVIDFVALMEGHDPENPTDVRKVGLLIAERFGVGTSKPEAKDPIKSQANGQSKSPPPKKTELKHLQSDYPVMFNVPLDFELKNLDPNHPYLNDRGFQPETIEHFGLGYCSRGYLAGRIAIPLHDSEGKLIGYAGRLVDDKAISEDEPKYKLPGRRERQGKILEFRKSLFLYNGHALKAPVNDLIVVEGYPAVWWLWQWQYRTVVGLMGASCSNEHAEIIVQSVTPEGRVWVLSDGDDAGEKCAASVLTQVAPYRLCRWVKLDKRQPTDLTPGDLAELLWTV
jgi:DNA primase